MGFRRAFGRWFGMPGRESAQRGVAWAPLIRGVRHTESRVTAAEPGRTFRWMMLSHAGDDQESIWGFDIEPAEGMARRVATAARLWLTGGAAHTAVESAAGLEVRPARMRTDLDLTGSQVVTERIAAVPAPRLGKAAAKEPLSHRSTPATESGRPPQDVPAETPELDGHFSRRKLTELRDPAGYTGGAGLLADRALSRGAARMNGGGAT